jgi:hypothetical protein
LAGSKIRGEVKAMSMQFRVTGHVGENNLVWLDEEYCSYDAADSAVSEWAEDGLLGDQHVVEVRVEVADDRVELSGSKPRYFRVTVKYVPECQVEEIVEPGTEAAIDMLYDSASAYLRDHPPKFSSPLAEQLIWRAQQCGKTRMTFLAFARETIQMFPELKEPLTKMWEQWNREIGANEEVEL